MRKVYNVPGKKDQRGMTLVEVLVSIAILSVVATAIFGFMVTGTRFYTRQSADIDLQTESQTLKNHLQDLVVDTQRGLTFADGTGAGVTADSCFIVFNNETADYVAFDASTNSLYYCRKSMISDEGNYEIPSFSGTEQDVTTWPLFGEYVSSFDVDLSQIEQGYRIVTFHIGMQCRDNTYDTSQNVSLRNDILANASINDMYEDGDVNVEPKVKTVTVSPNVTAVVAGNETAFSASVFGVGSIDKTVTWSVTGISTGSSTHMEGNILKVSPDEMSKSISVVATANGAPKPSGKADVLVSRITGVQILTSGDNATFLPGTTVTLEGEVLGNNLTNAMKEITWSVESYTKADPVNNTLTKDDIIIVGNKIQLPIGLQENDEIVILAQATAQPLPAANNTRMTVVVGPKNIGNLPLWTDGTFELNRGGSLAINAALENSGLMGDTTLIWEIVDYGGLSSSKITIDDGGVVKAASDIPYENEYKITVRATLGGDYLGENVNGLITITIPVVKFKFEQNSMIVVKGYSFSLSYTISGLEVDDDKISVSTSPATGKCTAYVSSGQKKLVVGADEDIKLTGLIVNVSLSGSGEISQQIRVVFRDSNVVGTHYYVPTPDETEWFPSPTNGDSLTQMFCNVECVFVYDGDTFSHVYIDGKKYIYDTDNSLNNQTYHKWIRD